MADIIAWVSEKCNRELGDFYFSVLLKWQTWEVAGVAAFAELAKKSNNTLFI